MESLVIDFQEAPEINRAHNCYNDF